MRLQKLSLYPFFMAMYVIKDTVWLHTTKASLPYENDENSLTKYDYVMTWKRFPYFWIFCGEYLPVISELATYRERKVDLLFFFIVKMNKLLNKMKLPVIWYDLALLWRRCN